MAKYDERFKLEVAQQYSFGKTGAQALALTYGLSPETVRQWAARYRMHGVEGLRRKGASYDATFKLKVLKRMRREQWSLAQTAAAFDIRYAGHISKWARQYDAGGLDALRSRRTGRPKKMNAKLPKPSEPATELTDKQVIAKLRQELIEARAEVAYLKKLDEVIREKREAQKKRRP